jgi:predicted ATPase
MIEKIALSNFKLFKEKTEFPQLKRINLLTGVNGRGKSTFLQSMLLIKQSLLISTDVKKLFLNGEYVSLGNSFDVKNQEISREEPIEFSFTNSENEITLTYQVNEADNQTLELQKYANITRTGLDRLQYVSAERIGPRLSYEKSSFDKVVGAKGEFAVDVLSRAIKNNQVVSENFINREARLFSLEIDEIDRGVGEQVEFWMTEMFGHTLVGVQSIGEANVDVMSISALNSHDSKPTNVGFGYSCAFPILVSGLTATAGDILVVENPEAHLHPSAQSVISKFLAFVSMEGVQVFVESHSEHILNALRVLVKQEMISNEDINVMFFDTDNPDYYQSIAIEKKGKVKDWPDGFFDQAEKDLNILLDL